MPRKPPKQKSKFSLEEKWSLEFREILPVHTRFTEKLEILIKDILHTRSIDHHLLEKRTKKERSFLEKSSRSNKKYSNPVLQITDITGIRVITYYQDDAEKIGALIEQEFNVNYKESEINQAPFSPSEFGYKSAHYIVSLNQNRSNLLEWQGMKDLQAEIQVRTVLQHAWAAISHKLQYKKEEDVPARLRRKLSRLSALFEISDDEFVSIREISQELSSQIESATDIQNKEISIDLISISNFLKHSESVFKLRQEAELAGFNFDHSVFSDPDDLNEEGNPSELISLCTLSEIKTIYQLEMTLKSSIIWARKYFEKILSTERDMESPWTATDPFICELILMKNNSDKINARDLLRFEWDEEIAYRVMNIAKNFK